MSALSARFDRALEPLREQLTAQLAQMQPRERLMLVVGAVAIALTILFVGIWKPAAHAHHAAQQRLDDAHEVEQLLQRAATVVHVDNTPRASAAGSLLSIVDQAAKSGALSKPLSRLQPDGDTQVRAWVEDVPFDALLQWMQVLQTRYGVRVAAVDIERQPTAGLVNARLSLVRGS